MILLCGVGNTCFNIDVRGVERKYRFWIILYAFLVGAKENVLFAVIGFKSISSIIKSGSFSWELFLV